MHAIYSTIWILAILMGSKTCSRFESFGGYNIKTKTRNKRPKVRDPSQHWAHCTDLIITAAMEITRLIQCHGGFFSYRTICTSLNKPPILKMNVRKWTMERSAIQVCCSCGLVSVHATDRNGVKSLAYILMFFHEKNGKRPRESFFSYWQASCLSLIRMWIIELL